MKFINCNPNRQFREIGLRLYIYGYANISDEELLKLLDEDLKFDHIRGQFAFVYIREKKWIACVDHICTTQLFYSKNFICPSLHILAKKEVEQRDGLALHRDSRSYKIRSVMGEYVPGTITPYEQITRLDMETYVENGEAVQYANVCEGDTRDFDIDEAYDLFVNATKRIGVGNDTILFSGGKESVFLTMLYKHLGYEPSLVHITSPNKKHSVDDTSCSLLRAIDWDIDTHEIEKSGPYTEEDKEVFCSKYWCDNTHPPKLNAVYMRTGRKTSGEVGTVDNQRSTYSSLFVNYMDDIHPGIAIDLHLMRSSVNNNKHVPMSYDVKKFDRYAKNNPEEWDYLRTYWGDKIKSIPKSPMYSHYMFLLQYNSSHRLYAQSQDHYNEWYNIFADYEIYNLFLNLDWKYKEGDIQKKTLYDIAKSKFGEHFTDIPWQLPIAGLGVPNVI